MAILTLGMIFRLGRFKRYIASRCGQEAHNGSGHVLRIHWDAREGYLGVQHDVLEKRPGFGEKRMRLVGLPTFVLPDGVDQTILRHTGTDDPVHRNAVTVLRLREHRVRRPEGVTCRGIF